ncbi:MAG: DUF5824 family protein [Candidatus Poseidoniales archaeon]
MKKIVFTFGRMNPPTIGHAKLVDKVQSVAKSEKSDARVYLSHTQNDKKDPLDYNQKIRFAKKAFGSIVTKSNSKTVFQIMSEIEKDGYTDVIMVVGSDRVPEFKKLLTKYNGKDYNFDSISVVSAGERDPDATGVEGMSASKLRAVAKEGDFNTFKQGLPKGLTDRDAKAIFDTINKVIKEDLSETSVRPTREPLTISQRNAKARLMRKLAPRIAKFRKMKAKRMADRKTIIKRAAKAARNVIRAKVAGEKGKQYSALSASEKITIDKLVARKSSIIKKLAKKLLPKIRKKEMERLKRARGGKKDEEVQNWTDAELNMFVEETLMLIEKEEKEAPKKTEQDPDVKDLPGTQPKKYYKGLSDKDKEARAKQFKRGVDKPDDDPASYKPAPGDDEAKTKLSKHTKKYRKMFGEGEATKRAKDAIKREKESDKVKHDRMLDQARTQDTRTKNSQTEDYELSEDSATALKKKSEKSGIPVGILRQVYNRGMAAWKTGHRPGATQQQWAYARVNSFITGGGARKADNDLWQKAKGKREEVELDEARAKKAVAGGKVQKLITGFGMTYKGKKYDEIDFELDSIDNSSQIVTLKILHPAEHIGDKVKVPFKSLRVGRFMATDTSKINEAVSPAQQAAIAISKKERGEKPKKEEQFEPHMMYDPESGDKELAKVPADHDRLSKKGWTHEPPKKKKLSAMLGVPFARPRTPIGEETELEEMPRWLLEPLSKITNKKGYDAAKKVLNDVLTRKKKEAGRKGLQHSIEYYAAQIAKQFDGVDARTLAKMVNEEGGAGEEGTDALVKKYRKDTPISEAIEYHTENGLSIKEKIFRPHSDSYYAFFRECRRLWESGELEITDAFDRTLMESDAGLVGMYEGQEVPLDLPLIEEEDKELNKPKRGGPKKFYVFVKDPSTGNIKKVTFGDTTGLKVKLDDPEARKSFAARHKCDMQKDKTKAAYWACRLPYYAKELGLSGGGSFFW